MPQNPMALVTNLRDRWLKFSRTQQVAIVAGIAVVLLLIIAFSALSQQSSYGVLFSNLDAQDASAIVAKLKAGKIPYQLADNGAAILVPTNVVADTRLMIAGDGLPNNGVVGFEIFDTTNPLGMTDFTQQLDYQRGLEGELTRTIEQIQGVTGAWVNIVLPQSSLYTSTDTNPTASIVVRMAPGATLDPGQVEAVMHLVASAVQGLKPADVTIVDTNGENLSDAAQSGTLSDGVTPSTYGTALDVEHQYEQTLNQQAMSMLNTVLGPGKAVVRINAVLNWDQLTQDSTTYGQQPSQVASQNTSSTTSTNGSTTQSGAPGTGSNLVPTPTATAAGSSGTNYSQTQNNTVYNVSQTVAHLTKAPGSVQRITVAVFLDGTYPAATISAIQQAVSDSIGLNGSRGDQIAVSALPFNHSTEAAAESALKSQQQQSQIDLITRGIAMALAALALIIFALRATRRARPFSLGTTTVSLIDDALPALGPFADVGGSLAGAQNPDAILMSGDHDDILASARQRQVTEAEIAKRNELQTDVLKTAREHPDLVANVIMNWFEE